ncbi:MAG TPA: hypothetical protein VL945_02080 [Candidatus Saccharimonadales bacterium]|nr:hypothetical protein [Candidatus Saccharimonadales bacterium]
MVKTTIILEDALYRQLVDESIREYGSTRKLSLLINSKLKGNEPRANRRIGIKPIRLGRRLTEKEIERAIGESWDEGVRWRA